MRNRRTGESMALDPWPLNPMGHDAKDSKYRFQWTFPIMNSPHNPSTLYAAANVLFKSIDEGLSWKIISPDLTVTIPVRCLCGTITKDQTRSKLRTILRQESPLRPTALDRLRRRARSRERMTGDRTNARRGPAEWTRISSSSRRITPGGRCTSPERYHCDSRHTVQTRTTARPGTRINADIRHGSFTG